ncbi:Hypothetical_protein [Hexamita inflata]|uniref:Hypothetical_protein n=1 Tax=Hexamita inflata TaxID=28002 RepID=A0AA86UEB5_9EUKA|nr:Hypothetical protein HINF_LOCUS35417 [Hexamita inflata]
MQNVLTGVVLQGDFVGGQKAAKLRIETIYTYYSKYEESISPKIKVQFDQQLFQDFVVDLYIWKLNARIIKLHYITMNVSRLRAQEINCFSHKSSFRTIYQTENSI